MGSASHETLQTVLTIIFILLLSLHIEYISMVDASSSEPLVVRHLNVEGQKELYFIDGSKDIQEIKIQDVPGYDEHKEKGAFVLRKLRALLGVASLHKIKPSNYDAISPAPSPSSSPSPSPSTLPSITHYHAQSPAPAPKVKPIALHPRHPHGSPHSNPILQLHRYHRHNDEAKDREKRVLIAIFASIGATLLICGIAFLWVVRRFYKHRKKKSTRTVSVYSNEGGGSGERHKYSSGSQSIAAAGGKLSYDPGFDLFYLNTLSSVLEPQTCGMETKWSLEGDTSNCCVLHEKEDLRHDTIRTADDQLKEGSCYEKIKNIELTENGCSSAEEIISVHEYAESVKYESDGHNSSIDDVEIIPINDRSHPSSDNESFHSLCNSHSSNNARLSNASSESNSLCDTIQCSSPVPSVKSPLSTSTAQNYPSMAPSTQEYPKQDVMNFDDNQHDVVPRPTPPPPPPPPPAPSSLLANSPSTWLARVKSKAQVNMTSTRNSMSPSASNQCLEGDSDHSEVPECPKPPTNIPAPPIFKGNSKSPPPPPTPFSQFRSLGKDGVPLPKLKPLHWDKLRATTDRSMVWDKLQSSSFELDEEMIESLFGYNLQNVLKNDEGKSKTPSPTKHVLEPKRLQNITILSKALNVTAEQVCNALIEGEGLSLQQLEAMVKMEPTKEEEAKLSNYKGDVNELGSAERLVKAMLTVPFAFQRIEAMLYRATFNDEVIHLRNSFSMLEEACNELRSSRLFLKLLEAVLKTGNRMNVGTIRGGAKAFKLDALLKLSDVKGTDGKTTLLHFVVQEIIRSEGIRMSQSIIGKINQQNKTRIEEKEEYYRRMGLELVSGLSTELCNVKKTASVDIDVLATSVSNLSDGMIKIQRLVDRDLGGNDRRCDNFVHGIENFVNHAEKKLKQLKEDEDKVLQSVREITEYFHGDVSKEEANLLRIFVIVRDFLGMLDQVCRELRSLKIPRSHNPLAPFR